VTPKDVAVVCNNIVLMSVLQTNFVGPQEKFKKIRAALVMRSRRF